MSPRGTDHDLPAADRCRLSTAASRSGGWQIRVSGCAPAPRPPEDRAGWASAGETAYAEALGWAIEDGEIDTLEVDLLIGVARSWSLDGSTVAAIRERLIEAHDLAPAARERLGVVERAISSVS